MNRQQREALFIRAYNQKDDLAFDTVLRATLERMDFLNREIVRYRTELNRIAWPREGDDDEPRKISRAVLNIAGIKAPHDLCANPSCKICDAAFAAGTGTFATACSTVFEQGA